MTNRANRNTRAPFDGRVIYCPKCGNGDLSFHFSWAASTCQYCWQMVDKTDWFLEEPSRDELPKKLPPVFDHSETSIEKLYDGGGKFTGITVKGKDVYLNGERVERCAHKADAKTFAMDLLKSM